MTTPLNKVNVAPGKYQHYKGAYYEVLFVAKHSESLEDVVVYRALYQNDVSEMWVRPVSIFTSKIIVNGEEILRFKPV